MRRQGKGIVTIPISTSDGEMEDYFYIENTWDGFHNFARCVAQVMEQKWPDRYTSNVGKAKRTNKIFIDWIRNGRGATSIAPYSVRARKGAGVSMPIAWDELDTVAPDGVNMAEALRRIGGNDPWNDFFRNNQQLKLRSD